MYIYAYNIKILFQKTVVVLSASTVSSSVALHTTIAFPIVHTLYSLTILTVSKNQYIIICPIIINTTTRKTRVNTSVVNVNRRN